MTALHEAAVRGDRTVVEELLRAGAQVNALNADGATPLHDAVGSGNYQVVKLLLEHGSNPHDKNLGGVSAMNMAESREMRELLQSFHQSVPGSLLLEANRASSDTENVGMSRTSARINCSKSLALVLSEVEMKQEELRGCSVRGPDYAGRCQAALLDIHTTLSQVLIEQQMAKDILTHKYRSIPHYFCKRILKSQLHFLTSVQKKLVDVIQKQIEVVDELRILKSEPASQTRNNEQTQSTNCLVTALPRDPVPTANQSSAMDTVSLFTPLASTNKVNTKKVNTKKSTYKNTAAQPLCTSIITTATVCPRQPVPATSVITNTTIEPISSRTNQRSLLKLLLGGVMTPGDSLVFLFKGTVCSATVESLGQIKDTKGSVHVTPEDWIKSIVGNNIPVSSAYAWDKVTFRDTFLSHHLLKMEQTQTGGVEEEQLCSTSAPDTPTAVPDGLSLLTKINVMHVVGDNEWLPNALMEKLWEQLVKEDNWTF